MTRRRKRAVVTSTPVRVRSYDLMCQAVEDGIAHGYRRAHKHNETPDEAAICSAIYRAVIDEICVWFDFGGGESDAR